SRARARKAAVAVAPRGPIAHARKDWNWPRAPHLRRPAARLDDQRADLAPRGNHHPDQEEAGGDAEREIECVARAHDRHPLASGWDTGRGVRGSGLINVENSRSSNSDSTKLSRDVTATGSNQVDWQPGTLGNRGKVLWVGPAADLLWVGLCEDPICNSKP